MVTYGDENHLETISTALSDDISDDLKTYALEVADTWVNSKLSGPISGTVPDAVEKAATFWAYAWILRVLYDTSLQDSPGAMKFEQMAIELLDSYISKTADEDAETHPYSGSLSPTHHYTERNLRTTTDDDDDIYYVSEDTWESEG
jgi:hypothetical protein